MKIAYVHLRSYHDPINKAFETHLLTEDGAAIRPHSEREELQFDRRIDILPGASATLEIEQSMTTG